MFRPMRVCGRNMAATYKWINEYTSEKNIECMGHDPVDILGM